MQKKNEIKHKIAEEDQSDNEAFIRQMKAKNTILKKMLTEIGHGPLSHIMDIHSDDIYAEDNMVVDLKDEDVYDDDLETEDINPDDLHD